MYSVLTVAYGTCGLNDKHNDDGKQKAKENGKEKFYWCYHINCIFTISTAKLRFMVEKDFPLVKNSMRGKKIFGERKEIWREESGEVC